MDRSVVRFAVFFCVLGGSAVAQEGGVVAEFCKDDRLCVDDVLEIVFESGSSTYEGPVETGVEIPIEVVLDTKSPGIQGYSWGVKHDSAFLTLIPERLTTAGTMVDPESPDTAIRGEPFIVHRAVEGGFISAVVLSLREMAALPSGRHVICRAAYRITAPPECTVIRFVDGQLASPGSPSVEINITALLGRSTDPRFLRHGLLRAGDCLETCDDLADNDGDGLSDCDDPDCAADLLCTGEELCDDGIDNNSNGKVDCHDPNCRGFVDCPVEDCTDGLDNDGDGAVDCVDPDCRGGDPCVEVCDDGIDNDVDHLTDCHDRDCGGVADCPEFEVCADGLDNDGDGFTDCDDTDCSWQGMCVVEVCDDGIDNDKDDLVDCDDRNCWALPSCKAPEVCDDGIDNDRDFSIDCDDWDCGGVGACPEFEACGDGRDNDGDGLTDCADSDCRWQNPCVEVCDDGVDNDLDEFVDGLDGDCQGYPAERSDAAPPLAGARPPVRIIRGDTDGSGRLTVLDAVVLIQFVVNGEARLFHCFAAFNSNGDEGVNVADAIPILRWIFLDGPPLSPLFPDCEVVFESCEEWNSGCR